MSDKQGSGKEIKIVLRCPFCDSLNIQHVDNLELHYYRCRNCWAEGPAGTTQQEGLGLWNKRKYNPGTREDGDTIENYGHRPLL